MANIDQFVSHIGNGMGRFGMRMESSKALSHGDMHKLIFTDTIHDTGYVAIARRKDAKNPGEFWGNVLDGQLKDLLKETAYKGDPLPAALIVPSHEAESILQESAKRGLRPSVYQLFDGYVVVGYKKLDSAMLLKEEEPSPEPEEETPEEIPSPEDTSAAEQAGNVFEPATAVVPEAETESQNKDKTAATAKRRNLKKLAAAALLGTALMAAPYAVLKNSGTPDSPSANQAVQEIGRGTEGQPGDPYIQAALAANAPLGEYDLRQLIEDGYLRDIARNPHIPPEELRRLARNPDPLVRAALGLNISLPADAAARLAEDSNPLVRSAVASNPNLSPEYLERLAGDPNFGVTSSLLDNPGLTPQILERVEPRLETATCENKEKIFAGSCATAEMLNYNAANPDSCIRRGVARNPRTAPGDLEMLAMDKDPATRRGALGNPSTPLERTGVFSPGWQDTPDPSWREDIKAALQNPSLGLGLMNQAMLNPGQYGQALASNPVLGRENARKLYDYSRPAGGMQGFLKDAAELAEDPAVLASYRQAEENADPHNRWPADLRKKVNHRFAKNVYNPKKVADMVKGSSPGGDTSRPQRNNTATENFARNESEDTGTVPFVLPETGEGGEFFDANGGVVLALDDMPERFGEFFEDDSQLGEREKQLVKELLETADTIVDDVMKELVAAVERNAALLGPERKELPGANGQGVVPSRSSSPGEVSLGVADNVAVDEEVYPAVVSSGNPKPLFDEEFYERSCKQVDSLLQLF